MFKRITANLIVDSIEKCLPFWVEQLGFENTTEVPHEDAIGFVILQRDGCEVMLQSRGSVAADMPAIAELGHLTNLFIEIEDIAALEAQLVDPDYVFAKRETFYGSTEICVNTPGGHIVTFAQFKAAE